MPYIASVEIGTHKLVFIVFILIISHGHIYQGIRRYRHIVFHIGLSDKKGIQRAVCA